jgi:GNAT superfamily N-acetyltransferase
MPVVLDESLLGRRVVVRYRRAESDARPPLTDAVGELVALTTATATILRRHGPVEVPRAAIVAARPIRPDRGQILDLELIASRGWRPETQLMQDGWLFRADRGWTGRANSILPVSTPSRPLPEMLSAAAEFYSDRGLPLQMQLPLSARASLDNELAGRGWTIARPTVVLTRRLATLEQNHPVVLDESPSPEWLAAYHYRGGQLPGHAAALLTRHDCVRFASVLDAGRVVAIARGAVDDGWLGVTAVEVDPAYRRHGIAVALMAALQAWAVTQGAAHGYLQVDGDNTKASALYARLGFTEHHRYHYRVAPVAA